MCHIMTQWYVFCYNNIYARFILKMIETYFSRIDSAIKTVQYWSRNKAIINGDMQIWICIIPYFEAFTPTVSSFRYIPDF